MRGSVTLRHDLTLDRGLSYKAALLRLQHERQACAPLAYMAANPRFTPGRKMQPQRSALTPPSISGRKALLQLG